MDKKYPYQESEELVAHGATGAVVGTTNTQTLTNKTLTAPVITGGMNVTGNIILNRDIAEVVVADGANTDVVSARALAGSTYEVWEIVASENNSLRSWHTVIVFRRGATTITGVAREDYDTPAGVAVTVADNGDSTYDINYANATGGGLGRTVTGRLLRQVSIA